MAQHIYDDGPPAPTDIGLDSQNNVYVCGTRISERDQFGNPTVSQMIAIRLDPLTGQLATGWPYIWQQTADGLNGALIPAELLRAGRRLT